MTDMGSKTRLEIETDQLKRAAGKAGQTAAASAVHAIPPPAPTVSSQLDAALALVVTSSEALKGTVDTADTTAATTQQTAITESPPVLAQQDQQGAQDYNRTATQFPMPTMAPDGGKVWST
jgi:hypothetical protein